MAGYILKRLLSAIPVLLGISIIVFVIMALIPGDPATAILGSYATPENVERLNRDLGLDQGLVARYFIWLGNMLQGDFGRSFALNRPVLDEVLERFNATLVLAGTSFVLCSLVGVAWRVSCPPPGNTVSPTRRSPSRCFWGSRSRRSSSG